MNENAKITISLLKSIGKEKKPEDFDFLLSLYEKRIEYNPEIRKEIISSIGRFKDNDKVYDFMNVNAFNEQNIMDEVYQFYRTALYKKDDLRFLELSYKIKDYYNNEVINKMSIYKEKKEKHKRNFSIKTPLLLEGNNQETLKSIKEQSVHLIFTSPPYYNAREYSDYKSYQDYLNDMLKTLKEAYRVLENGRFIVYNVSPVITGRPGREFTSHRYPIHFDFHKLFEEAGFTFIDEIIWIKPEASVTNRIGGFQQTRTPLMYKPNAITESIMVYRKDTGFLLDVNIKAQKNLVRIPDDFQIDTSNCWYIHPSSNKDHPAVFPEALCEKIITYYSFEGDVVLDPFAGSGTFGKVALKMNRIPVLCEQDQEYIKVIKKVLK